MVGHPASRARTGSGRVRARRSGLAGVFVVSAAALGCWQIKLMPYAAWLAAVALAQWAAQLGKTASFSPALVRIAAVVLLIAGPRHCLQRCPRPFQRTGPSVAQTGDPRRPCFQSANVRRLAALPTGLVAADLDLGPYIVALTPGWGAARACSPRRRLRGPVRPKPTRAIQRPYVNVCWRASNLAFCRDCFCRKSTLPEATRSGSGSSLPKSEPAERCDSSDCRRSVLAPRRGVDLEDAMGDGHQPTPLDRPQLGQHRLDEFRRPCQRRHALHVVANIGQRVAERLKIKQRRASFWIKNSGHVLASGYWAERGHREARTVRVSSAA